jgi:putative membrane protein
MFMKHLWLQCIAGAALGTLLAGGAVQAQDTTSSDKTFVKNALEGSLAEVNYAKLALQKSQDKNVREFATKMIHDHEMLISDMKPLAKQLGVKVPTGPPLSDHAKYMELKMKSGTDFDRAYVEAMVKDHHDDLSAFLDEGNKTSDPQLKAAVQKGESVIREHTEMIDKIAHMGGIETPPMPSNA